MPGMRGRKSEAEYGKPNPELGILFKARRESLGFSTQRVAVAISRHRSYVNAVERGVAWISFDWLRGFCEILQLDLDEMCIIAHIWPPDLFPRDLLTLQLYRLIKEGSDRGKRQLKTILERRLTASERQLSTVVAGVPDASNGESE